ncbi:UNVERIFIED_CONTAM: Retrovirus-related Pol polyprotein from transposon 17.6 [Sesamum indicum]
MKKDDPSRPIEGTPELKEGLGIRGKDDTVPAVKLGRAGELGILAEDDAVLGAAEGEKEGHVAASATGAQVSAEGNRQRKSHSILGLKMADGTRLKKLQEAQKKTDIMLVDERLKRQAHEGLHSTVINIENAIVAMQQQLQSLVVQLQNYNRNKSILGEGLTTTMDKGSSSRIVPQQTEGGENTSLNEMSYNSIHRMEFPMFKGEDARAWIRRCTRYFQMIPIPEGHKTALASIHMQGRAELWYQGYVEKRGVPTWQELIVNVLERFENVDYERVVTDFNRLHQETTVNAYLERFEELEAQMLIFNKHLKTRVSVHAIIKKSQQPLKNNLLKNAYKPVSKAPAYKPSYKPTFKARNENSQPRRLLTEAEMRARREKNLCYNCDEVFVPGHKCKVRYSYVLMDEEEVKAYEEDTGQLERQVEEVEEDDASVSLHVISGKLSHGTMRVKGNVNGREIQILIDSGSTHSFIDEKVMKALDLKTEETIPMKVRVAGGFKLVSKTLCPQLQLEMQGNQFSHIPSGHSSWGDVTLYWAVTGKEITLKALARKGESQATTTSLLSELLGRKTYYLVSQLFATHNTTDQRVGDPMIQGLLQSYDDVFQEPQSLPPERAIKHKIELIPDAIRSSHLTDYRYLNRLTVKHKFPIPVIDELLDELHGAKFFTKIDLRSGYFQIRMRQEDISKTSFITHSGHYEFLVMPFGLCNAPATFQALMNQVFEPFLRKFVLVFFDDILIYSKGWNDHLLHLRKVLELLRTHKLYAKKSKCSFAQSQIEYLGHIISDKGVATDQQKVQCMRDWPIPTTLKALRGFLGLTGSEDAFNHLKGVMSTAPVLAFSDFTKPFIVETDACGKGIGAVLMQEGRPIAYLSKALAPKNLGLSTYEKEFLALLLAVTKWKHYLQGHHFIIKTDQKSLKHILDQRAKILDNQSYPEYKFESGILRKGNKICVGSQGDMRRKIIHTVHDSTLGGHSGITGTLQRLKLLFFWPNAQEEVHTWVTECEVCQRSKSENKAYPASSIAKIFFEHIYKLHGLPFSIVSDRDKVFTSHFWKELFNLTGVSVDMSTAYHPQTDGQTERVNQCLETYLRCMCHQHPKKWSQWITLAEFWFNTTFHSGLKATPFEALYGYPPNQLPIGPYLQSLHSDVDELMKNKSKVTQLLKENLQNAQQRMKTYADKKRTEREFEVGDYVFLKLQPYRQASIALRKNLKLSVRYFGPYKVIERIGKVAYKLDLPPESKIHPIFHVSLLKKKIGSKYIPSVNLPELEDEVYKVFPLAILARRLIPRNNVGVPQVLIHWSHSSPEQATWEDYHSMAACFPDFDPWGQGRKKGGGNVTILKGNATSLSGRWMKKDDPSRPIEGTPELK